MPAARSTEPCFSVVSQKLIKPAAGSPAERNGPLGRAHAASEAPCTPLSCFDSIVLLTYVAKAWGFAGARIDEDALEAALAAMLADLPVLAGR